MKYLFKRDTFLGTLSVFLVMGLLSVIPLNTHLFDPLKLALTDINFNDLSFSVLKNGIQNPANDQVVVVNIGQSGRSRIAALITKLQTYHTKAIGLDVLFSSPGDANEDSSLASAIHNTPNIILSDDMEDGKVYRHNYFNEYAKNSGYVNFIGEDKGVIRYFSPQEILEDSTYLSFAAATVKMADESKFDVLRKRDKVIEIINYKRTAGQFFVADDSDIVNNKTDSTLFNNKIVVIGYVNTDSFNIEDKHFTPLNKKFVGKSIPDMNGAIIQANIISMILDKDYISKTGGWLNWFVAFLFTWLFTAIIIRYYIERHMWFHLVAKSIQLVLTVVFIYIGILFTKYFSISVNFNPTLVAIVLSVDVLYFFEGFTNWLHKKLGVTTIFTKFHH